MYYLAQGLELIALILWIIGIVLKDKKNILLYQSTANLIRSVEYSILSAIGAASMNFCSFIRTMVYYLFAKKKKPVPIYVLFIFVALVLLIGFLTCNSLFSLIPVIITLMYTYSLAQDNQLITRIIYIICACFWIYYNVIVGAHLGIVGNIFEIIASFIAILKYRKTV